ncbi:MAG: O-antigen ligase family protein [Pseudomonadota bacterium]
MRVLLGSQHGYTYQKIAAGLSLNALFSIFVVFVGIAYIPKRILALRALIPLYIFMLVIFISGVINFEAIGLFQVITKWLYFIVIMGFLIIAFEMCGTFIVSKAVFLAISPIPALQIASYILGKAKNTENDLSVSYIGGYFHEANFSIMLIIIMLCSIFVTSRLRFYIRYGILVILMAGIILANYRTALISAAPIFIAYYFYDQLKRTSLYFQPIIIFCSFFGIIAILTQLPASFQERFSSISDFSRDVNIVFQNPTDFTRSERDIFSARVYIWSQYIDGFESGHLHAKIIGHGPESWSGKFSKYAHNTLISNLYEFGITGFLITIILMINFVIIAASINNALDKMLMISLHIGFILLNMATMPLWAIEGILLYAFITALTIYKSSNFQKSANKF